MLSVTSFITVDRTHSEAIYIQIANQLAQLIRKGVMSAGFQLPSSRVMAKELGVHRKTVTEAYDELLSQGWLEGRQGSGTFVAQNIPVIKPVSIGREEGLISRKVSGFTLKELNYPNRPVTKYPEPLHLDDGFPDVRLAPLGDLAKAYRNQLINGNGYSRLGYSDPEGSLWLRQELAIYLNQTRGMGVSVENIMITRGTTMGLHLAASSIISDGDIVVTGNTCWAGAKYNLQQAGGKILTVTVDENGMDTDELELLCEKMPVRMVYVTSHHHYPTTVTLRADRRLKLLNLAERYGFAIFEDDYDYDFHYMSKPLLPLAASDPKGMVLYCGSFTKSIAPAFRVGYVIAAGNVIERLTQLRRIIDRQGDVALENAIADLLHNGIIQRHLRKSLREYRQRRDVFCELLTTELPDKVSFVKPDGGLAVWTRFAPTYNMTLIAQQASKRGLSFSNGLLHDLPGGGFTRLGFASSTTEELVGTIEVLKEIL
ncbi:PLP-dependent aminotransferase family protein [Dyadobacter luteus]|uniref:PLP-dependent aminotransferase family protein n=1 Tax=Dyadobacter luteus TaxID=2259619 RepID=A0A3D8Y4F3_9BACT|nr:PLP-dependent aminotransferase family protein [Dyadobacter luteus]REA56623.1 PLP-dependent aminotransferase family protein [Dyadobacter luteus]